MIYTCFVCGKKFARSEGGYVSIQSDDGIGSGHFVDLCGGCGRAIIKHISSMRELNIAHLGRWEE